MAQAMNCLRTGPRLLRGARQLSTESCIYDVVIVGGGMVGMSLAAALGALDVDLTWRLHMLLQRLAL